MSDPDARPDEPNPFRADGAHRAADGGHFAAEPAGAPDDAPDAAATAPLDAPPTAEPAADSAFRRRDLRGGVLVPVLVAAVVAALLGGGVGAGITLAATQHAGGTVATSTGGGSNIVIKDSSNATVVSAVAAKASPSVVTISVSASTESGTGSGIVLTSDGYVLTNNHVVTLDGDTSGGTISVALTNGHVYPASIVGTDPLNDLAVIKLRGASGLTAATFGDSSKVDVGDQVVAIGAPLDLPNTVTSGIISAVGRSIPIASSAVPKGGSSGSDGGDESTSPFNFWNFGDGQSQSSTTTTNIYLSVLQTDAAINPGNSGGALLNAQGQVIGVNVAIAGTGSTSSGQQSGSIGVGFAIPSDVARRIADDLMAGRTVTHGQLGVKSPSETTVTSSNGVAGVQVASVTAGGPAAKAGLQKGDVITAVQGVAVQDYADLAAQVRSYAGGSKVTITFVRDGASRTVSVVLGTVTA